MARISGVDLKDNDRLVYALTNIKGIGWSLSEKIINELKIDGDKRVKDLSSEELSSIASILEKYPTEGELQRIVRANINRLKQTGTYRGMRHNKGLPVRGQRTKTNSRTKRTGGRKTVGAFRKEALTKMQQTQPKSDQSAATK